MIDKTVLELVDRLVATSNRAAVAEQELERATETIENNAKEIEKAQNIIFSLKADLTTLKEQIEKEKESTNRTINYWADKATKLEKEMKALKEAKGDTEGS